MPGHLTLMYNVKSLFISREILQNGSVKFFRSEDSQTASLCVRTVLCWTASQSVGLKAWTVSTWVQMDEIMSVCIIYCLFVTLSSRICVFIQKIRRDQRKKNPTAPIWWRSIHLLNLQAVCRMVLYVRLKIYTCKSEPWHACIHTSDGFILQNIFQTNAVYSTRAKRNNKFWPGAGLFFFKLFRDDRDHICLDVCFIHSGKWGKRRESRGLIKWDVCVCLCVLFCRPADRPQRGGWGQPGGDSWICQSIQDSPAVPGPDTDSGGPGAQRCRGAGVQPVCHLQVRANKEGETPTMQGSLFWSICPNSVKREQTKSSGPTELSGVFIPCFNIIKILKYIIDYYHPDKWSSHICTYPSASHFPLSH